MRRPGRVRQPGRARNALPGDVVGSEKDLAGKLLLIAEALEAPHADPICAKVDAEHAALVRQAAARLEKFASQIDETWQEACDAELERCDEEYRSMRDAVIAFDSIVSAGKPAWDRMQPAPLQGCSVKDAADFAHRVRRILDEEPRLKALDVFEAHTGLKIDNERLARLDARAVRALHEEPGHAGSVLNNLKISLEQLEAGKQHILGIVERMEKVLRERSS